MSARSLDRTDMLGPYQLQQLIGRGGMGEVYRAFDTRRGRVVALKILQSDLARDEGYRARFRRESDTAARLQNPHVIPIHDFGEIDGRLYIDMRLVDGAGLDRIIAAGPLDPQRAVSLVAQVAEALLDAHRNGILHRDVKPSNILVTPADFVYLVDFGIARMLDDSVTSLTETGGTVGTFAYMAPERFGGGAPDARSDTYSLACTLAECLLGRKPFDTTSLPALMHAHLTAEPPRPGAVRPDVPRALDEVIARGMAKDPAARFATPRDLAAAAQHALRWVQPTNTLHAPMPVPPAPAQRGSRALVLAVAAVLVAAVSGGTGYALGRLGGQGTDQPAAALPTSSVPVSSSPAPIRSTTLPTTAAAPTTSVPRASGRAASYTYTVDSNYPFTLVYTDSQGNQVTSLSVPAPWTATVDTAAWGVNATPLLVASSSSTRGDTTVTCTITDDAGNVVASQTQATAFATASCYSF